MQVDLEIQSGPLAGKVIRVKPGQPLTVGRTPRSVLALPQDTFLSGIHFAVESTASDCRVVDRDSTNGTFLNRARITEAVLRDGDEISAGRTVFKVRITENAVAPPPVPPKAMELPKQIRPSALPSAMPQRAIEPAKPMKLSASPPAAPQRSLELLKPPKPITAPDTPPALPARAPAEPALRIGSWSLREIPSGWVIDEGYGIHCSGSGVFPSEAVVTEDQLDRHVSLQAHIESEMNQLRQLIEEPEIKIIGPAKIPGSDEALEVSIRYKTGDGRRFVQRQIYARSGQSVGVLTLTTQEDQMARVREVFDFIVSASAFREANLRP